MNFWGNPDFEGGGRVAGYANQGLNVCSQNEDIPQVMRITG